MHRVKQDKMEVKLINHHGVVVHQFDVGRKRNKAALGGSGGRLEEAISGEMHTLGKRVEDKVFKIF